MTPSQIRIIARSSCHPICASTTLRPTTAPGSFSPRPPHPSPGPSGYIHNFVESRPSFNLARDDLDRTLFCSTWLGKTWIEAFFQHGSRRPGLKKVFSLAGQTRIEVPFSSWLARRMFCVVRVLVGGGWWAAAPVSKMTIALLSPAL